MKVCFQRLGHPTWKICCYEYRLPERIKANVVCLFVVIVFKRILNPNPKCMLTLSSLRRWKKPRFGWGESDAREKWVEDLVVAQCNTAAFSRDL